MSTTDEKLTEILEKLSRIENALKIVPDREAKIEDIESSIENYKKFALEDLKLNQSKCVC